MCIQTKQTLMKLLNPQKKRYFGVWLMNLPTKKRTLSNAIIFYLLLIRIFSKLKSLSYLLPRKDIKLSQKNKSSKLKRIKSKSKFKSPKKEFLEEHLADSKNKTSETKENLNIKKKLPKKNPSPGKIGKMNGKQINWSNFSENFRSPSIFIESWEFLEETIESIVFDSKLMDFIVEFSAKYFKQKNKDQNMRRTIKAFMRIFLVMKRDFSRDSLILEFLADIVNYHQVKLNKGKSTFK